jgi:hypothetical protein
MTPAERNRADFPLLFPVVAEFREAFGRVKDLHMRSTITGEAHGKPHDFTGRDSVSLVDIRLKPSAMEICESNITHE